MGESGHNSTLTDGEMRALRMMHIRDRMAIDNKIKELAGEKKKINGLAKADGFKIADIDAGVRLMGMEDQSIFVNEIKSMIGIAQDFGAIPNTEQFDMFTDRRDGIERAENDGTIAGLMGKDPEANPYEPDSEQGQAWLTKWNEGQAQAAADLVSAMEKRNTEKDDGNIEAGAEDPDFPDDDDDAENEEVSAADADTVDGNVEASDKDWDASAQNKAPDPDADNVVAMNGTK